MRKKGKRFLAGFLVFAIILSTCNVNLFAAEILEEVQEEQIDQTREIQEKELFKESQEIPQEEVEQELLPEQEKEQDWQEQPKEEQQAEQEEGQQEETSKEEASQEEVMLEQVQEEPQEQLLQEEEIQEKQIQEEAAKDEIQAGEVCFVQEYAKVGSELTVQYSGEQEELRYIWYRDGQEIEGAIENTYIPSQEDLEKTVKAEVYRAEQKLGEVSIFCSKLPVIYIDTENAQPIVSKEEYLSSQIKIQGNDAYNLGNTTLYNGIAQIRGRGNSTWKRFDKKPYKLKLDKSTDLFGMGKSKHWALLANYIDGSLMRNPLSVNIAKQLEVNAMDSVWVDVILNGECIGSYQLYEQVRVDKNRVDIFDWDGAAGDIAKAIAKKENFSDEDKDALAEYMEQNMGWMTSRTVDYKGMTYQISDYYGELPDSTNGGYLMELTTDADEVSLFTTDRAVPIQFKSPEYINTNAAAFEWIRNYVQQMENTMYNKDHCVIDGEKHISYLDYCDINSLVAYWLTCEVLKNEIGYKSNYFYKVNDMPMTFGPIWDFDFSSGSVAPFGAQSTRDWASSGRSWFCECMKDPYFAVKAKELYDKNIEYFRTLVSDESFLDEWYEYLKESGEKDFSIWHYSRTIEEDYAVLKSWLKGRVDWLDKQFKSDDAVFASLGVPLSDNLTLTISGEDIVQNEGRHYWGNYKEGQMLYLNVHVTNGAYSKFNYYVNGRYVKEEELKDSEAVLALTEDMLTEGLDNKNTISVWLKDDNGELSQMQCVTLTMMSENKNYYNVTFHDQLQEQARANVYAKKKAEGGRILLPDTSLNIADALFEGWSDGETIYAKNTYLKVEKDMDLYAVWAVCADGVSYSHNWEENGNYEVCRDCQKQKEIQREYIDVASCAFYQSNRYKNSYTGFPVVPIITVQYGGRTLTENVEYSISIKNNINAGFATYEITGIEAAGFTGKASLSYKIIPKDIARVTTKYNQTVFDYDGTPKTPIFTITFKGIQLKEGKDYIITYENNVEVGTATAHIKGIGNFTGQRDVTYTIKNKEDKNIAYATVSSVKGATYTGTAITREVTVKDNENVLKENIDYTISYENNINVGKATMIIKGIGAYEGEKKILFNIVAKALTAKDISYEPIEKQIYTKRAITPPVIIKYKNNSLTEGKDYTLTYKNNIGIGTASIKISGQGNYRSEKTVKFTILPKQVKGVQGKSAGEKEIHISWNKYNGVTGYRVYRAVDRVHFTCIATLEGKEATEYTNQNVVSGKSYYYKVRAYKDTSSGKRYYGAMSDIIVAKAGVETPSLLFARNEKRNAATIQWEQGNEVSGYEIYQTDKKANGKAYGYQKIATVKGGVTTYTSYNLSKKTYYYKIRAYKVVSGQKIYSDYSNVRGVTIKK